MKLRVLSWILCLSAIPFCPISTNSFAEEATEKDSIATRSFTFNKDIAPVVFQHCSNCHRPGEVAPFPLLTYRDVAKRASLIQSVVDERSMPPWKAEAGFGHFADERRLSDDQVAMINRWIELGTPEGKAEDLPEAPKFVTGWQLGQPDQIVTMTDSFDLVAEGPDLYQCFVLPFKMPDGKYLKAVEYRPGNRRVVHHAVLTTLATRIAQTRLKEADGKSFASGLAPPGQLLPGQLAFWTPGMTPRELPRGFAMDWPENVELVLQLHLHPSGKEEKEKSSIGLYFTDEKPKDQLKLTILNNSRIDIPPGEKEHEVTVTKTIRSPVEVYGVFPHMHLIGRSVKVTAKLPDGSVEPLISIPDWNFNWQHYYQYKTPVKLPEGTVLEGRWTYDNSSDNPANPSHPPKRVTYGEQTANEMAILTIDYIETGPSKKPAKPTVSAPMTAEQAALRVQEALKLLDKDQDGKVSFDEVMPVAIAVGSKGELKERLAPFDRDNDEKLDPEELAAAIKALRSRQR